MFTGQFQCISTKLRCYQSSYSSLNQSHGPRKVIFGLIWNLNLNEEDLEKKKWTKCKESLNDLSLLFKYF